MQKKQRKVKNKRRKITKNSHGIRKFPKNPEKLLKFWKNHHKLWIAQKNPEKFLKITKHIFFINYYLFYLLISKNTCIHTYMREKNVIRKISFLFLLWENLKVRNKIRYFEKKSRKVPKKIPKILNKKNPERAGKIPKCFRKAQKIPK